MDADIFRRAQERYDAMEHPDYWREDDEPTWCDDHGRWECDHIDHDPKCQHGNLLDDGCDKCEASK